MPDNTSIYRAFKQTLDSYTPISDTTWYALKAVTQIKRLEKNQVLYQAGDIPATFVWVFHSLIRGFVCDEKGNEYNKKFFGEGMFPGTMLTNRPSKQGFDALEETLVIEIDFLAYRRLLLEYNDLKLFQIYYLEKNWLLDKDEREIAIVQLDASVRYQQFLSKSPRLWNA